MGNDGGSIPKRVDLVKSKPKEYKKDYNSINKSRSKHCALSNQRLKKPIVGCKLGYLYNKEYLIERLIKKDMPRAFRHIKKYKHVVDINVDENPDKDAEYPLICPLSKLEHNGINKFIFLWKCGCMMSQKIFERSSQDKTCPNCSKKFKIRDIIKLWESPEEFEAKKDLMFKIDQKTLKTKIGVKLFFNFFKKRKNPEEDDFEKLPENVTHRKKVETASDNILDSLTQKSLNKDRKFFLFNFFFSF